jgi:ketosteroid isomerase-like protein
MPADANSSRAREMYEAFAAGDRATVEGLLSDDFAFSSPVDPRLSQHRGAHVPGRADLPRRGVLRVEPGMKLE